MRKRVVVFVASLGGGGAERVAASVSGWLRDAEHNVCLLTLSSAATDFYACPQGVTRIGLDLQSTSANHLAGFVANLRRIVAVRRAVLSHNADVVLSLGDRSNVLMLLSTIGLPCRKLISERADPLRQPLSPGWKLLRRMAYPMATLHVSQSRYISEWLLNRFPRMQSVVIGNSSTIPTDRISERQVRQKQEGGTIPLRLIAVGRFSNQKGFDLLLEAIAKVKKGRRLPITLDLIGDGDDRMALVQQVGELGLEGAVTFRGRLPDVEARLRDSDVFVLSSRWEGFPNVMIEAMSVGLPVIAARCPGGVEDVLGNVPDQYALDYSPGDVDALADCIVRLAEDVNLRDRLARSSLQRAADYGPDRIAAAWRNAVEAA